MGIHPLWRVWMLFYATNWNQNKSNIGFLVSNVKYVLKPRKYLVESDFFSTFVSEIRDSSGDNWKQWNWEGSYQERLTTTPRDLYLVSTIFTSAHQFMVIRITISMWCYQSREMKNSAIWWWHLLTSTSLCNRDKEDSLFENILFIILSQSFFVKRVIDFFYAINWHQLTYKYNIGESFIFWTPSAIIWCS